MLDQFQLYINRYNLIAEGDKLVLALSGGIDSMVLADLLLKAKVEFVAAHCNFHLRGYESDGDDWFVRKFAENRGIQCFVKHFETEKYAAKYGISIEMAARELRYTWFEQLRQQLGYDKIAVAHHADDQAETFFINLLRGAGLNGLKGMKPQNGVIIRPLFGLRENKSESMLLRIISFGGKTIPMWNQYICATESATNYYPFSMNCNQKHGKDCISLWSIFLLKMNYIEHY